MKASGPGLASEQLWSKLNNKTYTGMVKVTLYLEIGRRWGERWEGGSGWGTDVHPWLIHVNVWQNSHST